MVGSSSGWVERRKCSCVLKGLLGLLIVSQRKLNDTQSILREY